MSSERPIVVFTQHRRGPITLLASEQVRPEALDVAAARIERLLAGCPQVAANLERAGAQLQIVGEHERITDLPQYRHMRGVAFDGARSMDERGRGYGGLFACCAEEALLALPSARHADHRDVCSHEVAHTILAFGLDRTVREQVEQRYREVLDEGLWDGLYAATNAHELFAELTMWYVGSHGERGPEPGPEALRAYDPTSYALLDAIYTGRLEPRRLAWPVLHPATDATDPSSPRSLHGEHPTTLVFHNQLDHPVELHWLDYQGAPRSYGTLHPGALASHATYATHPWLAVGAQTHGPFVPDEEPARVMLGAAARV